MKNSTRFWEQLKEGEIIPKVSMQVTFKKVIHDAAATNDYFPGHHDPEYARGQGQKNIYLNTMALEGFIDRIITDWSGPHTFITRRKMTMSRSVYAGDLMSGEGRVLKCYVDDHGRHLVDVEVMIGTLTGPCIQATATIQLPGSQNSG